jgi:hypothetical protein
VTDNGPKSDVPHARFDLSIQDLPVVVPGFVGPFRIVLLALSAVQDEWQLHYAAMGDTKGGVRIEAEDDTGNSYDVRGGTESGGDADPIVGRWDLIPPAGVEPTFLRLTLFFDEWSQQESWDESVEDKRERARRWIDILEAQLAAAEHRHLLADLMYTSDERTTAIARVIESLDQSEFQAHFVADLSLGRMTEHSRQRLREQLGAYRTELRRGHGL